MYKINQIPYHKWQKYWVKSTSQNLLQSWNYGEAKKIENWIPYRFLISNEESKPIAIFQILIKKILFFGSIARLNRGPVLLNDINKDKKLSLSLKLIEAIIKEVKKQNWFLFYLAPEIFDDDDTNNQLKLLGLKKLNITPWSSGIISLIHDENDLMMNLHGKWRNCLRKGLKLNIKVSCDKSPINISNLLDNYNLIKKEKSFTSISNRLLKELILKEDHESWEVNIFNAYYNSIEHKYEPIGSLVSIISGDNAIYLIGTTNQIGRKLNANYVLIWKAMLEAKNKNCKWFDIGGLNKDTTKGIKHFKTGLKPQLYKLIGEYRMINLPWNL